MKDYSSSQVVKYAKWNHISNIVQDWHGTTVH